MLWDVRLGIICALVVCWILLPCLGTLCDMGGATSSSASLEPPKSQDIKRCFSLHRVSFRFVSFRRQSELSFIMVSFIRALPCMMIIESISWTRTEAANQIDRAFHHTGIVLAWREWISSLATLAFECVGASKCDFTFFFWNSRQDWWACNKIVYAQVKMLFIIYSIALSSTFFIFIYMSY